MAQLPLGGGLPLVHAWTDYGPVGRGASSARYVLAENGTEYIIKGPDLSPGNPYVAANEVIFARLAQTSGLPLLDCCLLELQGTLYFGSSWMEAGTFYPAITADLLNKCGNRDRVYDVVALDAWLCNTDRNNENLVVRKRVVRGGQGEMHLLLLNDHSHALVAPGITADQLNGRVDSPPAPYVALPFVRDAMRDAAQLSTAIAALTSIGDGVIEAVMQSVPDAFLPQATDRTHIESFLIERRNRLRDLFEIGRTAFPNLGGGSL